MNEPFAYLVAYDVSNDSDRVEVAEILLDMGGIRLQKSLFSVRLEEAGLVNLRTRAQRLIVGADDKLGWWRTCGNCPGILARMQIAMVPSNPTEAELWIV